MAPLNAGTGCVGLRHVERAARFGATHLTVGTVSPLPVILALLRRAVSMR